MGITLGAADISEPGVDEGSGLVLSVVSFEVTWVSNIEGEGPGEGDPVGNSEVTRVGIILGISGGEVRGITLGVSDRSKLGDDEGSRNVLSGGSCEGARYVKLGNSSEELEESAP